MENIHITINLTILFQGVIIYLITCMVLTIAYTIYYLHKHNLHKNKKNARKKILKSILISPLFPIFVVTEIIDNMRARKYKKPSQASTHHNG